MAERKLITAEELRRILSYDHETGLWTWLPRSLRPGLERIDRGWNTRFSWKPVAIRLDRRGYQIIAFAPYNNIFAHRLAWFYITGKWPAEELDHINGNPLDNRMINLREATRKQNMINQKTRSNNTSGVKGVSWSKKSGAWYAYINKDKIMYSLGMFDNIDDAIRTRKEAEREFHGEWARITF